jgi:uncharacterized protein (TIGR03000 family)
MYGMVLMAALTAGAASEDCCWGRGYCGCYGGGYGGCYGGCYGGGWGGYYGGCYGGCYGGGWGGYAYGVYGCYGCYGGWSCYGSGYGGGGVYYGPTVAPNGGTKEAPEKLAPPSKQDQSSRAKVIIDVPAQAKLYIDDQPMSNKTGQRTFVTPPLERGQTYFYDVKIVLIVDGQEKVQTQRVVLRAGEVAAANFSSAPSGTATAQANGR